MNVLNGCAWKGGKLHISFAKANKFRTLEDGRIVVIKNEEEEVKKKKKKIPKKKRNLIRHAGDFSLVTDKNVDKRKGWRRGRYGRAIACLRIRRPNRQMLIIDPSHYKNNLEKLFGSIRPKPLSQLSWTISEIGKKEEDEEVFEVSEEEEELMERELVEDYCMEVDDSAIFHEDVIDPIKDVVEVEPVQNAVVEPDTREYIAQMDTELIVEEDPIIINSIDSSIVEQPKSYDQDSPLASPAKPEAKFEVNVNWSSLFGPSNDESVTLFGEKLSNDSNSGSFSLNSLIEKSSKIKNVSMDELFKKHEISVIAPVKAEESEICYLTSSATEAVKKVHNYAHLFGDLNRITPTTATRFGMHLSRKEDLLQEWRIERLELKEDFKKRLAEGKRRNRRGNKNSV